MWSPSGELHRAKRACAARPEGHGAGVSAGEREEAAARDAGAPPQSVPRVGGMRLATRAPEL